MNLLRAALQGHGPIHRFVSPPPRPFDVPVEALPDGFAASVRRHVLTGYFDAYIAGGITWVSIRDIQEHLAPGACCYDEHSGCYVPEQITFDHEAYEAELAISASNND